MIVILIFLEVDKKYPYIVEQTTKQFPFASENNKVDPDDFTPHMNGIKTDS